MCDTQGGLRCFSYARRVLDAATILLDANRAELRSAAIGYTRTNPTDPDAQFVFLRYRDAVEVVLMSERTWIAAAAQYAADKKGLADLRQTWLLIEQNATNAWETGDKRAGRALFEEAALYDQAIKRGQVLRVAADETARRLNVTLVTPRDCSRDEVVLPAPVVGLGLAPLLDMFVDQEDAYGQPLSIN